MTIYKLDPIVCAQCNYLFKPSTPKQRRCADCLSANIANSLGGEYRAFPICPCGKRTISKSRKYCDAVCRSLYAPKQHADRHPDWVGICGACGEEFTRSYGYANNPKNSLKYCSNACANRNIRIMQKEKFLSLGENKFQVFDSVWEMRFWIYCLDNTIPCEGWGTREGLETQHGLYYLDFLVTYKGNELIIDVKGEIHEHFENKMNDLAKCGVTILLVGREDLEDMSKGNFAALEGNGRGKFYRRNIS